MKLAKLYIIIGILGIIGIPVASILIGLHDIAGIGRAIVGLGVCIWMLQKGVRDQKKQREKELAAYIQAHWDKAAEEADRRRGNGTKIS